MPATNTTRPRRFDLIAFDWDGTLYDSTAIIARCIQAAVRDVGGTVPSDKAATYVIGLGLMQALVHAAPDVPPEKHHDLGQRYRFHYARHSVALRGVFDGSRTADQTASKPHPLMLQELMAEFDVAPQRLLLIG